MRRNINNDVTKDRPIVWMVPQSLLFVPQWVPSPPTFSRFSSGRRLSVSAMRGQKLVASAGSVFSSPHHPLCPHISFHFFRIADWGGGSKCAVMVYLKQAGSSKNILIQKGLASTEMGKFHILWAGYLWPTNLALSYGWRQRFRAQGMIQSTEYRKKICMSFHSATTPTYKCKISFVNAS